MPPSFSCAFLFSICKLCISSSSVLRSVVSNFIVSSNYLSSFKSLPTSAETRIWLKYLLTVLHSAIRKLITAFDTGAMTLLRKGLRCYCPAASSFHRSETFDVCPPCHSAISPLLFLASVIVVLSILNAFMIVLHRCMCVSALFLSIEATRRGAASHGRSFSGLSHWEGD